MLDYLDTVILLMNNVFITMSVVYVEHTC